MEEENDAPVSEVISAADQAQGDGADWETQSELVGLESGTPAVVELTQEVSKPGPPGPLPPKTAWAEGVLAAADTEGDKKAEAKELSKQELEELEATFQPKLMSSAKIRNKAKSTGYGTKVIGRKPAKPVEGPTFSPAIKVGKGTDARRAKAAGSQYGKQLPKKKPLRVEEPSFKPEMVNKGVSAKMRAKAQPKIFAEAKKVAVAGKSVRAEYASPKAEYVSRYTLAGDRAEATEASGAADGTLPPMVLDGAMLASSVNESTTTGAGNKMLAAPPKVKHSKMGKKLLNKAVSRYAGASYTPPKAAKPTIAAEPKWNSANTAAPAEEQAVVTMTKRAAKAVSKYGRDYSPPKSARPMTPKVASPKEFATALHDSPIGLPADELAKPKANKFTKVKSSGYGTVSPVPSVAAKVESYKHRSGPSLLGTKAARDAAGLAEHAETAAAAADKENPAGEVVSHGPIVDDLLTRAALLDPKIATAKPAVLGEGNGNSPGGTPLTDKLVQADALVVADIDDDDHQLTML